MNEPAWIEAIASDPDEPAHRLVFADWLEDRGDAEARARAAFIREQLERDALPWYHPRARELALREARAAVFIDPARWAAGVAPLVRSYQFRRGFVEQVRLTPEQLLSNGARLFALAPVRCVQLRGTLGLPALLSHAGAEAAFADLLVRLRELDLNRDYTGEAAGQALLALPRLPRLSALRLGHNALTPAGIGVLAGSDVLSSLRALDITVPASAVDALQSILHSPKLANLTELSLAGARLGDRVVRMLTTSPLLGRLTSLNLSHNALTPAGLRALTGVPAAAGLRALDLSFNPLGPDGARCLERSPYLANLRVLNLSRTDQGDDGARILADGRLLGRLEAIDLSLDHIGTRGALALAGYPHTSGLLSLDLIYNPLGQYARAALMRRFGTAVCQFRR